MEMNELVPNMAVVNPQAYNQLLKKQLTKNKKVGTALKNKKDPLHKRARLLVKKFLKREMLNYPNYLRNQSPVPQNNPDGEHRYYNPETSKRKKSKKESIMNDNLEKTIREIIRNEIKNIRESEMMTEEQFDEKAGKKDACYHKVKARYDVWPSAYASGALVKCRKVGAKNWGNKSKKKEGFASDAQRRAAFASGYEEKGKKKKKKESVSEDRTASIIQHYERQIQAIRSKYPPGTNKSSMNYNDETKIGELENGIAYAKSKQESYDIFSEEGGWGYTMTGLVEAEYQGRKVKLGKPMQGDVKKFKVYVKNPKGNVVKVNFGQGGDAKGGTMRIRKSNPKARANFRARHNCDNPGPRHKARYWSCRKW
tara:strand:- start:1017 stop:2120 length:1104 start_codon:yes stop_codon:yes gene_type:complete